MDIKLYYYYLNSKFDIGFKLTIAIMAAMLVFVSFDPNTNYQTDLTLYLQNTFYRNFIHPHFSIFQFFIIIISFYIIKRGGVNFSSVGLKEKIIIFATLINIILLMVNPNNNTQNPILGMPLLSDPSLYVGLLFIFSVFTVADKNFLVIFIGRLTKYVIIFAIIRVILLFLNYFIGTAFSFYNISSTLMEEDSLLFFGLISLFLLSLYFLTRRNIYLIAYFLFFIVQLLSFRRSGMLLTLLTSSTLFLVYYFRKTNINSKLRYLFIAISIVITLSLSINSFNSLPKTYQLYLSRYLGSFIELSSNREFKLEARNDHIDQANAGFSYAIDKLGFWGFGYGSASDRIGYVYLNNTGIHNAYFSLWEQFGFYYLLYYGLIIFIFLGETKKTIINLYKFPKDYIILRSSLIIYLFFYFINSWVLVVDNLTSIKAVFIILLILASLFYITPNNYKLLFPKRLLA
jgi:hypothetical protein